VPTLSPSVFVGGIMQGSLEGGVHSQGYRRRICDALRRRYPAIVIVDPFALHPQSLGYDDEQARVCLLDMADRAAKADLAICYVPEASMGTAIEMIRAWDAGRPVVTVSPLRKNWVVRCLSAQVYSTLEALEEGIEQGRLDGLLLRT
jgi:hypothetical protein